MVPAMAFSSASASSSSGSAVVVRVDKATSEFLTGPDWTINIDICDTINSNQWLAKDVVKAVKRRLQHKNPNVQLLSLTLLETMVKNCGDNVHFQIAERSVLPEMIKIVKKKADMRVREKILVLLDSWQEAFGGRGGKYPQYYYAYEELRHSGVEFPRRSPDAAPIFTPPPTHQSVTQPSFGHPQAGYGMPSNSSTRLDEAMASEIENLSLSLIESMRSVSDLLSDMLQAVDPRDRAAVKDEVIVDVADRCRSNQKKLMQMLASTSDEELLVQGLDLNDNLQSVLAKHDAIASGSPIPLQVTSSMARPAQMHESPLKPTEDKEVTPKSTTTTVASPPVASSSRNEPEEEEEEEDDFALLARRHSRTQSTVSQNGVVGTGTGVPASNVNATATSDPSMTMALALTDPPPPVSTTKAQDMIDFLSLTLYETTPSPHSPTTPLTPTQNLDQSPPVSTAPQSYPYPSHQPYPGHQAQPPAQAPLNSYVVPWAQTQPQTQPPYQVHPQQQNYSTGYIPPPWASTPGYYNNPYNSSSTPYGYSAPRAAAGPPPYSNSPPANSYSSNGGGAVNGETRVSPNSNAGGPKPFIPSYRLFEDLNVLGNSKTSSTSPRAGQSMLSGKK